MPSPKSGTVTPDIVQAVKEYGAGKLEYRNDAGGNVHAIVGKASFSFEDLQANIEKFHRSHPQVEAGGSQGPVHQAGVRFGDHDPVGDVGHQLKPSDKV